MSDAPTRGARAGLAVLLLTTLGACTVAPSEPEASDPIGPTAEQTTQPIPSLATAVPAAPSEAERQLASLTVTERFRGDSGYRRDAFGSRWRDTDGNGCN